MRRVDTVIALTLLLGGCVRASSPEPPPSRPHAVLFDIGTNEPVQLDVRVADTTETRRRGLMGVMELGDMEGMAFVFDGPTTTSFWMKDTPIPLSIAFVDGVDRIVAIRDMTPCASDPCPTYGAGEPFVLAVEANLGFFRRFHVRVGDTARLVETGYA